MKFRLDINGDENNLYAHFQTDQLADRIERDNPYSPRDHVIFRSGVTSVGTAWFRRYCIELTVIPNKPKTHFNVTAIWTDENEKIQGEYKIFRIYTSGKFLMLQMVNFRRTLFLLFFRKLELK